MIIDSTCSVTERKIKEVYTREQALDRMLVEEPQLTFKVSDFIFNMDSNITITTGSAPVFFSFDVLGNTNAEWNC